MEKKYTKEELLKVRGVGLWFMNHKINEVLSAAAEQTNKLVEEPDVPDWVMGLKALMAKEGE